MSDLNDVVWNEKSSFPCGENRWEIIRMGYGIFVSNVESVGHMVMIARRRIWKEDEKSIGTYWEKIIKALKLKYEKKVVKKNGH